MRTTRLFSAALLLVASTLAWAGPENDLSGNEVFDNPDKQIDFGKLKYLKKSDSIFIPFVEVKLQNWGTQGAMAQTGGLFDRGSTQTAKSRSTLSVAVDPNLAQELATQLHQDLVEKMRTAGWKVITLDDVKENKHYQKIKWEDDGELGRGIKIEKNDGKLMGIGTADSSGAGYIIAVPEGQQFIKAGATGPAWPFRKVIADIEANIYVPTYTINTLYFSAEEKSRVNKASASVDSGALISLANVSVYYMSPKAAGSGIFFKKDGYGKNNGIASGKVVSAKDTSPKAANALGSVFTALGGAGIKKSSSEYVVEPNEEALRSESLKLAGAFNDVAAQATALYKGK